MGKGIFKPLDVFFFVSFIISSSLSLLSDMRDVSSFWFPLFIIERNCSVPSLTPWFMMEYKGFILSFPFFSSSSFCFPLLCGHCLSSSSILSSDSIPSPWMFMSFGNVRIGRPTSPNDSLKEAFKVPSSSTSMETNDWFLAFSFMML